MADDSVELKPIKNYTDPDGTELVLLHLRDHEAEIDLRMFAKRKEFEAEKSTVIYHRTDGHATECEQNEQVQYWQHGRRYREDGPALYEPHNVLTGYYLKDSGGGAGEHYVPRDIVVEVSNQIGIDLLQKDPFKGADSEARAIAYLEMIERMNAQKK